MDRSILRELCSWSSNLTNFSFWKRNTNTNLQLHLAARVSLRAKEITGTCYCPFYETVGQQVACAQHWWIYMKHVKEGKDFFVNRRATDNSHAHKAAVLLPPSPTIHTLISTYIAQKIFNGCNLLNTKFQATQTALNTEVYLQIFRHSLSHEHSKNCVRIKLCDINVTSEHNFHTESVMNRFYDLHRHSSKKYKSWPNR